MPGQFAMLEAELSKRSKNKSEPRGATTPAATGPAAATAPAATAPAAATLGRTPSAAPATPGQATPPPAGSLTPVGFDYRKLALASPQAEFEAYARSKVKTAERLGQKEDVELLLAAFEMGQLLLARKPEGQS